MRRLRRASSAPTGQAAPAASSSGRRRSSQRWTTGPVPRSYREHMKTLDRLVVWVVSACVLSAAFAALFVTAQQMERLGADDAGSGSPPRSPPSSARALDRIRRPVTISPPAWSPSMSSTTSRRSTPFGHGLSARRAGDRAEGSARRGGALARTGSRGSRSPGLRFATVSVRTGTQTVLAGAVPRAVGSAHRPAADRSRAGWGACMVALAAGAMAHTLVGGALDAAREAAVPVAVDA